MLKMLSQVKTHLQSRSALAIAVGHQHDHYGMWQALRSVYGRHGLRGLWRGSSGALARVLVGSSSQLSTFSTAKEYIVATKVLVSMYCRRIVLRSHTRLLYNAIQYNFLHNSSAK